MCSLFFSEVFEGKDTPSIKLMADGAGAVPACSSENNPSDNSKDSDNNSYSVDKHCTTPVAESVSEVSDSVGNPEIENADQSAETCGTNYDENRLDEKGKSVEERGSSISDAENLSDHSGDEQLSPFVPKDELESNHHVSDADKFESSDEVFKIQSADNFVNSPNNMLSYNGENTLTTNPTDFSSSDKSPSSDNNPKILKRILYSGYKKKEISSDILKPEKKIIAKGNPFNPSWKKESKTIKMEDSEKNIIDLTTTPDSSGLNFQECTHYLGLQPSINFRCNHCGISGFESIQLLNLHQVECRKVLRHSTSTNIKLTRKVYLCSACGTYYESWNLFYHMRKVHDKFMCLHCLGMFTFSEKLCEHLMLKHQVSFINFSDFDSFKKCNLSSYFFLCLECDNVMSDTDNFRHVCKPQRMIVPANSTGPPFNQTVTQSQGMSVPCAGTVTIGSGTSKKGSLRQSVDGNNLPKQNTSDDFISDPSNFCHVNMESPKTSKSPVSQLEDPITEPTEVINVSNELTKMDILPPGDSNDDSNTTDKVPEIVDTPKTEVENQNSDSETPIESIKTDNKIPVKAKSVKRKRTNTARQSKRSRQDTKKNKKSTLEKLIDATESVANILLDKDLSIVPSLTDDHEKSEHKELDNHDSETLLQAEMTPSQLNQKEDSPTNGVTEKPPIWKSVPDKNVSKFKLQTDLESDEESDDSNKLSMVIDETPAHSDNDSKVAKVHIKGIVNSSDDSSHGRDVHNETTSIVQDDCAKAKLKHDEIALAGEDVPAMALTLDDKVHDVKAQHILKECVRTSCMSCNYCRRAVKIAVNGKQLALHLLSEHRYTPVKNDSPEDVINKLKSSLDELANVYFNTESYDSSDPSIHVPYDKDNTFDCFQCSYVTYSHKDLYIHKRKSHTKSLLLCIMCKINFYSYSELLCHLCPGHYNSDQQLNNVDINFRCCFCQLDTIPSAFRLMVHLRKCHHTCDICLEICSDQQKLSTHMWKHKLNHLCYRCGIAYASKLDITKHLFWKHGTESVLCKKCLQKKWPHVYHFCIPPTSFLCEECNSSFSKAVALKVHKRIHAGDFSHHCTQCEKKFVSKKLLQKHEDQHNNPIDPNEQSESKTKEEIIDVTGESTGTTNCVGDTQVDGIDNQKGSDKEADVSKHHKKHKKDKKAKQVIDVYDLPPLNLSSDSDSSDNGSKNTANEAEKELKDCESKNDLSDTVKDDIEPIKESILKTDAPNNISSDSPAPEQSSVPATFNTDVSNDTNTVDTKEKSSCNSDETDSVENNQIIKSEEISNTEEPVENTSIWENFYKTNSNNKNLPYPLCAMKTEDAYKIIMGDHDYCLQLKSDPVIKEDILTQSNLECDNKVEPTNVSNKTELSETTASDFSPTKKKQKSPKKKNVTNSSSSSDSSSDSDSSSCSCEANCSCSSSSSDSSSSSSSDSDSSASEGASKQRVEKRKKRKEKKSKASKSITTAEQNGENKTITETVTPSIPEEPTIRESDLETDESSTDEEFYDRQPQKITNQLLAEKRNQLMLLASVAPVHSEGISSHIASQDIGKTSTLNDGFSDPSGTAPSTPDLSQVTKKVNKARRRKSFVMKSRKRVNRNYSFNNLPQSSENVHKSPKPFNILKLKEPRRPDKSPMDLHTPPSFSRLIPSEHNSGSGCGSENDNVRASKRKRVPNKFYGYSSGEEEDRAHPKWRKPDVVTPPPPPPPPVVPPKIFHSTPQTPRIQLSVPKQVIRKSQNELPKVRQYVSSNDSTDSSSDNDKRFVQPSKPQQPMPSLVKPDKNLYCYCRCPYDEVSEMIACDDEHCKIEWFHFECVGISVPPKGQWYCPQCSKKRGIIP